jgi:hypothetical protein
MNVEELTARLIDAAVSRQGDETSLMIVQHVIEWHERLGEETGFHPTIIPSAAAALFLAVTFAFTESPDADWDDYIDNSIKKIAGALVTAIRNDAFPDVNGEHSWRKSRLQ